MRDRGNVEDITGRAEDEAFFELDTAGAAARKIDRRGGARHLGLAGGVADVVDVSITRGTITLTDDQAFRCRVPTKVDFNIVDPQPKRFKESGIPASCKVVLDALNSGPFLDQLQSATGIQGLLSDADLVGGGLHQIEADGFLNVHVDFNFHPRKRLHRRMNLLVYLNPEWDDAG